MDYLRAWKEKIPDLPEINFDKDADHTFNEIKDLNPTVYRKLLNNDEILNEIINTLFPERKTLNLLHAYFNSKSSTIYRTLSARLGDYLGISKTLF